MKVFAFTTFSVLLYLAMPSRIVIINFAGSVKPAVYVFTIKAVNLPFLLDENGRIVPSMLVAPSKCSIKRKIHDLLRLMS